ncbi:hormogonium polysaccharide biosynthesis glycosyltransferase HpsP [Oscillatoria sp. FACHB-1406]|uniref:hormogonium polysaccharide biosynthesis glycosyltransferase HpsP n=1 Tax=Oscillatoria sp. FACHB-1406 TaxID=2692846 RepID=UPI0016861CCA|nr:hormogonium polysaccharide biosynthesis glycosyltransferase HpsP [Oscillatoria sp. FACHB-1406]MBD2577834.1 glycosyltransferase [Oscillatoria sp. FACHB-1406]
MKILQIVPSISLVYGGPSQMVRGLSAALAARGVEVMVLTTDSNGDAGQPPLDVPLDRPVAEDGYQVRYFRCSPFRRYKFSVELLRWLGQNAREYDLAHIHALFSPVSTAAATVARSRGLPYILRPLGTLDPADLRKKQRLKQIYAALWERKNIAGAAALHFTSDREAEISHRFGAKTRDLVLPLGVQLSELPQAGKAREKWGIAPEIPLLLFMSRLDPKKGFDLLFPALEALQSEGVEFHFVLAGSNSQAPDYERQIRDRLSSSPLNSRTTIAGFVTGIDKLALLRDADLFVLPSYYENFGIAVAEAMLAGLPVVISDRVDLEVDVRQAGAGWVGSCQIESLTNNLRSAITNEAERQQRGKKARDYALEHYSWDAIAARTLEAYKRLIMNNE